MPNQPILEHLWIIPLLPLLGATINGLFGARWPNKIVNTVALSATGLSFLSALEAVREFLAYYEQMHQAFRKEFFDWIFTGAAAGNFRVGFDLSNQQLL